MKYLFIIAFVFTYCFFGLELGYTATFPLWKHFTYMFQHGNVWHLVMNSFSFFIMFGVLQRYVMQWYIVLVIITAAVTISLLCTYSKVVVGASGMVYAMMGMFFFLVTIRKIRYKDRTALVISIGSVITFLLLSFIRNNSAGLLHLLCMWFGYIAAIIYRLLNKKL